MDTRGKEKGIAKGLMDEKFNMFMETVDERFRSFVSQINEYLTGNGCKCDMKLRLCCILCVKQRQKDFGNIRIPKNGDEAAHLSRTYSGIPQLS